jgi:DnaK suppressor protein
MNASVTKSARKSTVAKKAPAKATVASSKSKPAGKSPTKTAVKKAAPAKTAGKALKPATKTVSKTAAKPAAKTVGAKKPASAKTAAKTAAKTTAARPAAPISAVATPVATAKASTTDNGIRRTDTRPAKADAPMSASKATPDFVDNIQKPVVSKVTEVATKTTKSTSSVPQDGALLTEEQLLQMSEKDYMNEAQLAFFKARLQALEKELLKNAGETTEHLRETVLVPDPADRATIEEEHALELRTRDRERKLLKKVQQSLASIDSGDYGWCEETGEPIGIPRLLARPTATLSLEAQQRRELKQKLYGD